MKSRLYPNGFFFSRTSINQEMFPSHYLVEEIFNYNYYYDKHTRNITYIDDNNFIIIHGLFVHIDPEKGNITKKSHKILLDLYQTNRESFFDKLDFLGGRFVIIVGNKESFEVFGDAAGMRSVFYCTKDQSVGSHINLMNDILSLTNDEVYNIIPRSIETWDNTQFKELKSINPNFYYNSCNNSTTRFFPRQNNIYSKYSHREKLQLFEYLWKEQLSYFYKKFDKVIFSLTGGKDSRVSLSLAKDYMKEIQFFTYAPSSNFEPDSSRYTRILVKDKLIVDQLLNVIPLNHRFFLFRENKMLLNEEEKRLLRKNTVSNHGRFLLPYYNHYFPEDSVLHIRGNVLEIGRAYFITSKSKNDKTDVSKLSRVAFSYSKLSSEDKEFIDKHIEEKINEFNYDKLQYDYHVLDLYYWEIRMGRWMAEVLNETDLSFETLMPFNMRALIDISLSYTFEERKRNYLFDEIINKNYPILNFFGKNNMLNLYEQLNEKEDEVKPISLPKAEKNNSGMFKKFSVFGKDNVKLTEIENEDNLIYIPSKSIEKGNYSQLELIFSKEYGSIKLSILNKYFNRKAKDYLKYQVIVNNKILLEEDLALWKESIEMVITGLVKGDKILLKIISHKRAQKVSWQKASEVEILNYQEISSQEKLPLKIYSNSPHSIIL